VIALLVAVVFAVYTLAQSKWIWYMVPLYPGLALILAGLLLDSLDRHRRLALLGVASAFALAVLSIPAYLHPYPVGWAIVFGALALTGAALAWVTKRPLQLGLVPPVGLFFALVSASYIAALYPAQRPAFVAPARAGIVPVAVAARDDGPALELRPVGVIIDDSDLMLRDAIWPDVVFYSRRPMRSLRSPEDLEAFLADGRWHDVLLTRRGESTLPSGAEFQAGTVSGDYMQGRLRKRGQAVA
jgi:hypothetical protein